MALVKSTDPDDLVVLRLPLSAFEALHAALDKVRSTSRTVTVDKDALRLLLADHSACLTAMGRRARDA